MDDAQLRQMAKLLAERAQLDEQIAEIVGRKAERGNIGEWIAAEIFDIELEQRANNAGYDGRFRSGPLQGRSVNIKWYGADDHLIDKAAHHSVYRLGVSRGG